MASIYQSIEILSKEKGIDPQIVLDAVKDAMLAAARKHYRSQEDLIADLDEATGNIQIYAVRRVVETVEDPVKEISLPAAKRIDPEAEIGSEIREAKPTDTLGRIPAQTAKQVILQKVREAERDSVYSEFQGRQGELVTCIMKRLEAQDYVVDMGKTEARLPKKEQSRIETFGVGDRVRCVIKGVERGGKFSGVIVSRAAPELVMRLFEQEVPEIYDGTVTIKACAREAGERTKIAVASRDRDVDSVGACVGMKGMRVQSIIRELRGEKIDIIEYSDDPIQYVTKALSPAKISRVTILDSQGKHMEVVVDDLQLSLAIGKRGQNVRLAAKLMGWKIDIKSEEEKRRELEARMEDLVISGAPVSVLIDHGLDESIVEAVVAGGIGTVEKLGSMTPEELEAIPNIDEQVVSQIQSAVMSFYGQYDSVQAEAVPADAATLEAVLDASGTEISGVADFGDGESIPAFENIETGVLERDLATHENVALEESEEGEVLDLGRVEGLSAAPSTLHNVAGSNKNGENSDNIESAE
ncbi:MAG: transcription termination/antitermination protein NusA [Acidobacteriaceae bacterium]|nr:transcription termination/antitermination protein NusA [Acidobacteriaceae bacterium]